MNETTKDKLATFIGMVIIVMLLVTAGIAWGKLLLWIL